MIWETIARGTSVVWLTQGVLSLFEWAFKHDIRPHRFYSTQELANLLGIERIEAIEMVRSGKVKGKKLDGNYRILGSAILEYMSQ